MRRTNSKTGTNIRFFTPSYKTTGCLTCKLHQSITGWHAGPVKNAADLDVLVINWGHSL